MLEILAAAATAPPADTGGGTGGGWGAISAAAAVGGLVATIVTTVLGAIFRNRNRPEPDWYIELSGQALDANTPYPGYRLNGSISNVGDGVAHRVRIVPVRSATATFDEYRGTGAVAPLVEKGAIERISVTVPLGEWENATLQLEWIDPPTRLQKKGSLTFRPGDYMDRPGVTYTDPETGVVSQRYIEDIAPQSDE